MSTVNYSQLFWTAEPSKDKLPVNTALLKAAKQLLQSIYNYSSTSPDYMPSAYTLPSDPSTDYFIHATRGTIVAWPAVNGEQFTWSSEPGTSPASWSGTVICAKTVPVSANAKILAADNPDAGTSTTGVSTSSNSAACYTDCSGFATALLACANQLGVTTVFTGWNASAANSIPEAGCYDPPVSYGSTTNGYTDGSCAHPNSNNYFSRFINSSDGFESVSLADAQPGDLLAFANMENTSDSGHIMLIVALAKDASDSSGNSQYVIVADETLYKYMHDDDSRNGRSGVGLGIIKLVQAGSQLQFYWKGSDTTAQLCAPAIGRVQGK